MSAAARPRCGFTLTEILMAVGILGVGLTMVASVFPVAVDQSRRSRESTMAAMCARSVVAMMKARRIFLDKNGVVAGVIPWCRRNAKDKTDEMSRVSETTTLHSGCLPGKFRAYNPNSFLYDQGRLYLTTDDVPTTDTFPTWMAGNYVPVVFVSPISATASTTGLGPWRVTIVVYRAGGNYGKITGSTTLNRNLPEWLDPLNIPPTANPQYLAAWSKTNRGTPGDYIIDFRPSTDVTNPRGEAYLVDRVILGTKKTGEDDKISLATRVTADGIPADPPIPNATTPTSLTSWVSMPKAVAVFHTVIGE